MAPSRRATRWRGPQPVRAVADPDASNAEKNACETNGLYPDIEFLHELPALPGEAGVSRPLGAPWSAPGLAQASQSAAGIWAIEETASRVISDDAIGCQEPVTR